MCLKHRARTTNDNTCSEFSSWLLHKPVRYMDEFDKRKIALNMMSRGGSFVKALGAALMKADAQNTAKISRTWPDYIEEYSK